MGRLKKEAKGLGTEYIEKKRKEVAGAIRHKANTKRRLIATVGKVIKKYGYPGLTYVNVSRESGLDRRMIYTYFGSLDKLIEEYIRQNDFWSQGFRPIADRIMKKPEDAGPKETTDIFISQFDTLLKNRTFRNLIHWELGEKRKSLRNNADNREEMGEPLLQLIDPHFENTDEDIRATLAIILGGIYYLTIHGDTNGSTICGVDINEPDEQQRIRNTIERIIYRSFEDATRGKSM